MQHCFQGMRPLMLRAESSIGLSSIVGFGDHRPMLLTKNFLHVASSDWLSKCSTVARSRSWSAHYALLFKLRDILLTSLCSRGEIGAGDRGSLFQKCQIVEGLVFTDFHFRCWDIFFQIERIFLPGVVLLYENVLEKFEAMCSEEVHPNMKQKLLYFTIYIRRKQFQKRICHSCSQGNSTISIKQWKG